jgi:hypothetical protein
MAMLRYNACSFKHQLARFRVMSFNGPSLSTKPKSVSVRQAKAGVQTRVAFMLLFENVLTGGD